MDERLKEEIKQGRKICNNAETIWGWDSAAGKRRVARRVNIIEEIIGTGKRKNVLEIGSGAGIFTQHISHLNINLFAVDISLDLIKRAKEKTPHGVDCIQCNIEHLPFPDNSIDFIFGVSILHHLRVEFVMPELRRVLKYGGQCFFSEPNMLNPHVFVIKNVKFIKKYVGEVPHETAFTKWQLKKLFNNNGFRDVKVLPFDFLHPYLPGFIVRIAERFCILLEETFLIREISGSLIVNAKKPSMNSVKLGTERGQE